MEVIVPSRTDSCSRRDFTLGMIAAAGTLASGVGEVGATAEETKPTGKRGINLGFDNFSIRAFKWNASQVLDYAAKVGVDSILLSNLEVYESFDESYLKGLRDEAAGLGVKIQAGTVSICPTSETFNTKYGTAEEHLSLLIQVA